MTTTDAIADGGPADRARPGARVGMVLQDKWTLDALLGVGGMAAVYAATHRNGKRVAVKMLHAELSHDEEIKRALPPGGLRGEHDPARRAPSACWTTTSRPTGRRSS